MDGDEVTYQTTLAHETEVLNFGGYVNEKYEVFDGTQNTDNCTSKDHNKWTYNTGIFLMGAATMYNYVRSVPP